MTKLQKRDDILDYVFQDSYVKFTPQLTEKILSIDKNFDLNRLNFKNMPIKVFYNNGDKYDWNKKETIDIPEIEMEKINTLNCDSNSVWDFSGFKLNGELLTDMNVFIKRINEVTSILDDRVDYKTKQKTTIEYKVKFLPSKKNIKTFRFVLHSYATKACSEIQTNNHGVRFPYYINGNKIDESLWKKYSREFKLNRILKIKN